MTFLVDPGGGGLPREANTVFQLFYDVSPPDPPPHVMNLFVGGVSRDETVHGERSECTLNGGRSECTWNSHFVTNFKGALIKKRDRKTESGESGKKRVQKVPQEAVW